MLLNKREFSKLSQADQKMLMKNKQKPKKSSGKKTPSKKQRPMRSNLMSGEARGVASAYSKGISGNKPHVSYQKNGKECRVIHQEFIQNVTGSTAWAASPLIQLNPGLASTFPWLSNIANNFETYRCNKMCFRYLTRTGTNVPGSIMMAPDYDAADALPISEQIMSNYQGIAEDAPWKDITCHLTTQGMHNLGPRKFVRAVALPANQDVKTFDVGNFIVATVDGTAVNWGKLWVEYDFSFYEPQLNPAGPPITLGGLITGGGTQSAANPLGTVPVVDPQSLGFTVDALSNVTFNATGTILVTFLVGGTGITGQAITLSGGAIALNSANVVNAAATSTLEYAAITVIPGSVLAFAATATTVTSSAVRIGVAPLGSMN